jgi:hypothetical protein
VPTSVTRRTTGALQRVESSCAAASSASRSRKLGEGDVESLIASEGRRERVFKVKEMTGVEGHYGTLAYQAKMGAQ